MYCEEGWFLWWWWWLIWHLVPLESCWFQTTVEPPLMPNSPQWPLLYSGYIPNRDLQSCHTDQNFPFIPKSQKFLSQSQSRWNFLHHIMMSKPHCYYSLCSGGARLRYFSYCLKLHTRKNNGFPFLDILGYLKRTHKNPKFGKVRQVPTREFPTKFPVWDLSHSSKFGIFVGILY